MLGNSKIFLKSIPLLSCLLLLGCGSATRFTDESNGNHEKQVVRNVDRPKRDESPKRIEDSKGDGNDISQFNNLDVLESETGEASYYGTKFNGRITANGEKYNMYALTAAHKTYPFDTIVRVTNLENNKAVIVRINDRYPSTGKRLIDLSYEAASKLGMIQSGIARVRLDVLKWGGK